MGSFVGYKRGASMKKYSLVFAAFLMFFSFICFATTPDGQGTTQEAAGSPYDKLGIQPGDRILSYDGKKITSANDSMEFYKKLENNSVKTVIIERNGKKQTLKYQAH